MTREEAFAVVEMILNSWTQPHWTDQQTMTYINALVPYDADLAVQAVAYSHKELSFRPSFADLLGFYRRARTESEMRSYRPNTSVTKSKIPDWVKEWVCARFMYARFGREQDMRRFTQQGEWRHPDDPLMPPGEWAQEAARISDRGAWASIRL